MISSGGGIVRKPSLPLFILFFWVIRRGRNNFFGGGAFLLGIKAPEVLCRTYSGSFFPSPSSPTKESAVSVFGQSPFHSIKIRGMAACVLNAERPNYTFA